MHFKLDHHNKILTILESFNRDLLNESFAYFGGGTLLTLDFEEYRWSKDVDFICPVSTLGYKNLRTAIYDGGYKALFHDLTQLRIGHSTTDQYGIRMLIIVGGLSVKVEIIAEVRFELDPPRYLEWTSVPCLSLNDCFTSKLLANSDRFRDDSLEARDLIDLAVLRLRSPIPPSAIDKAEKTYEVMRPLKDAVQSFQTRPDFRYKCFEGLRINSAKIPRVTDGLDLLAKDLGLSDVERAFQEKHDPFGFNF
jgi:hypothetical protein